MRIKFTYTSSGENVKGGSRNFRQLFFFFFFFFGGGGGGHKKSDDIFSVLNWGGPFTELTSVHVSRLIWFYIVVVIKPYFKPENWPKVVFN